MERRLAAILAADVAGYSRLMGADEAGTLERLKAHRRELIDPKIAAHRGRLVKLMGDGALVEFASVVDAAACAIEIQREMAARNAEVPPDKRIEFRIGINLGDVIVEGEDIYGDGVNVAARLEGLAEPGGICLSGDAYRQVRGKLDVGFEDLGERELKNVVEPVRIYRLAAAGDVAPTDLRATVALPLPDRPSIAVLPFTNMSGDPEQEYFSDGITEDIITELSRFHSLFVIARNSSFHYKGQSPKTQVVGRELGVQYLVEGSVRKSGSRVRVTAQLVEAATGNHLWAERYDRELADIFAVQDELVQAIASAVPERLGNAMLERGRRKPAQNLTAYDLVLRGEWHMMANFGDTHALALFEKAIAIDPQSARAYSQLAVYHAYSVFAHGAAADEAAHRALELADKALASDPTDPRVQAVAAQAYILVGNHDLARQHIERAVALNPNDIKANRMMALVSAYFGEDRVAQEWNRKHLRLDPHFPQAVREILYETAYLGRRYAECVALFSGWRDPPVHMYCELAAGYAQLGRAQEARAAVAEFERKKPPGYDFAQVARAHARMCARADDAEHWLAGYRKAGLPV